MKCVAKSVGSDKLGADKLCAKVSRTLDIHRKAVDLAAAGLVDIMPEEIEDGKTIRSGDFGLFRPSFVGKRADTQEGMTANNIMCKRILFFPGKAFSMMLDEMSVTRMAMPDMNHTDDSQGNEDEPENPDISGGGEEEDPLG